MKKRGNSQQDFLLNRRALNSKCSQGGTVALMVILGVIIAIILFWLLFSKTLIKASTVFCEDAKYKKNPNLNDSELYENFNRELCMNDCIEFCTGLNYTYEGHYKTSCRNPRVTHACGCRCS